MDLEFKKIFLAKWQKYFKKAPLPICFYYSDEEGHGKKPKASARWRCMIADLGAVRKGGTIYFDVDSIPCAGGKRYSGFRQSLRPNFEYFLSCGIEGELKGERYKKTPELVNEQMRHQPPFKAPAKYIVFKRFDNLDEADDPEVAIFFATPDVLAGLFTLANFDQSTPQGIIAPFGSGCSAIIYYPLQELNNSALRPILGMFDVSARPYVPADILSFAIPWPKFVTMVGDMDESFLITDSWKKIRKRIDRTYI